MAVSTIILSLYSNLKSAITAPLSFIKSKNDELKQAINDFKYKLHNLRETNIELGIYHLYKNNINDGIIRFKLIDKFFAPNDEQANYWLGWSYFLKNNLNAASRHLTKANKEDRAGLKDFLENNARYEQVPDEIWKQYRDLIAEYYVNKFDFKNAHLPYKIAQCIIKNTGSLPEKSNILELGSNIGLLGYELRKYLPEEFSVTGVESSSRMNELIKIYYKEKIYDNLVVDTVQHYLTHCEKEFDVIVSFNGLSCYKNLNTYLSYIYKVLSKDGYLAFCLPCTDQTKFSIEKKEFIFNEIEVKKWIEYSQFALIESEKVVLNQNSEYYIFICNKRE